MAEGIFHLNYENKFFINTTPSAEPTWAPIAAGIKTVEPDGNEQTASDAYYDGGGITSTEVTGGQVIYSFSGERCVGDAAQDYIAALKHSYGNARKTTFKHESVDGKTLTFPCTIVNIKEGLGDANSKGAFSFEIHAAGAPQSTATSHMG